MNQELFAQTVSFLADSSVSTALRLLSKPLGPAAPDEDNNWSGVVETMANIRAVHRAGLRDPAVLAAFARHAAEPEVVDLFEALPAPVAHAALTHALHTAPALHLQHAEAARSMLGRLDFELNPPPAAPVATWSAPFGRATKKSKKIKAPEVAAFAERVHGAVEPVPVDEARDREMLEEWARWPRLPALMQLSDELALEAWQQLQPGRLWLYDLGPAVIRFGLAGLETSLRLVAAAPATELGALASVESPRLAEPMAAAFSGRPTQVVFARAWFSRFPEAATVGLVPRALAGAKGDVQRALKSLRFLRTVATEGFARGLAYYAPDVQAAVEQALDAAAELPAKKPELPAWASPQRLPPVFTVRGELLAAEGVRDLLALLKSTPLESAPWVDALRATFTAESLTALASALTRAWLLFSGPPKERWALWSCAHFPSEALAQFLAQTAAEIAPRGLSARAQEMVEVLAAMRTRTALKLVHQLSRKVRSKAFRARTELVFTAAAESLGLAPLELAERLVPDFGVSPDGVLPGLSPQVRLVVDGLKAQFVDGDGRALKSLPEAQDPEVASELAELKKKASSLLREIAARLETRLATGERMSAEHYTEVYLMHGLARPLANALVWGVYSAQGALIEAFTVDDMPKSLGTEVKVGLVHPKELNASDLARWRKRLPHQPIKQLERRVASFDDVAAFEQALRAHVDRTVTTGALMGLEKRQWLRGEQIGGGCYVTLNRGGGGVLVELGFEPGIYLGDPAANPNQRIAAVTVTVDREASRRWAALAVTLSEIAGELHDAVGDD